MSMWITTRRAVSIASVAAGAALVVMACGPGAPTPAPTAAPPSPTSPPAATATTAPPAPTATARPQPTATSAPAATATPAPTATRAPAPPSPTAAPARPRGDLRVAVSTLGGEVWWPAAATNPEQVVMSNIYETLLRIDPVSTGFTAGLAERWEATSPTTWRFFLKKGVPFHKGEGVATAEDAKYSLEIAYADKATNLRVSQYREKIKSIEVVDQYTLAVNLKGPTIFLRDVANSNPGWMVTSKKYADRVGAVEGGKKPVGTGPFQLASHSIGDRATLEAVDAHHRKTAEFAKLIVLLVPDDSTRLSLIRSGGAEMAEVPTQLKPEMARANVRAFSLPSTAAVWVNLVGQWCPDDPKYTVSTPWVGPIGDQRSLKVRKALNLAVNRKVIIDNIFQGEAQWGDSLGTIPMLSSPRQNWASPAWKAYPHDVAQAKALLAEAGYAGGAGFPTITMPMFTLSGRPEIPDVAESVAIQWEQNLGLKVKREKIEYAAFRPIMANHQDGGFAVTWFVNMQPSIEATMPSACNQPVLTLPLYREAMALAKEAQGTPDEAARAKIEQRLGSLFYDNYLVVPLGNKNGIVALAPVVKDWQVIPGYGSLHNFEYVSRAS